MTKPCLFYGENCEGIASSKEHVINNSRRIFIKNRGANLGNMKARFRGITCSNCNSDLGSIEEKTWSGLAIATLWKVLAGNINDVFERAPWAKIHNTDLITIKNTADILRTALIESKVFPENMFGYNLTDFGIIGVGGLSMNTLTHAEVVNVFQDVIVVKNSKSGEQFDFRADFLLYHSHRMNGHRLLFFLPLIPQVATPWGNTSIEIIHKGFGRLAKEYLETNEGTSCKVYKYIGSA